jgi:beta-glucosidase-like glycosyl hydrolase/CubicO group peptidase (beta-lactamase class C family)
MNHPWVDSVFNSLSAEERIAQLIWVAAFSNRDIGHEVYLSNLIRKSGIGGVIFFQDQVDKQTEMINYFQLISKVPLMVVTDGEWGIGMRLEGIEKFPFQMTLGAVRDDSLIYRMGKAIAQQFKRAGVAINLAPVADVSNNPLNPVINFRSFGEDPENASRKTLMYMNGLQDNGIIAVAKHFPGHGDTEIDSHLDLPVIRHSRARLDSVELMPFKTLIKAGITGIMPGHLSIPSIDSALNLPATLSYKVLTQLLKNELSFKGLILSDAMNMGGVTKYTVPGEAAVMALKAGMDVLEYVEDPEMTIGEINAAIKKGVISQTSIDEKCRKVLAAKFWAGLNIRSFINSENIKEDLSSPQIKALIRELYANSMTVLINENNILPVKNFQNLRIASVAINKAGTTLYQYRISKYHPVDNYYIDPADSAASANLLKKLSGYDLVIAGVYGLDQHPQTGFGIKPELNGFLDKLKENKRLIVTWFGNPYALETISSLKNADGLLLAYQENDFTEDLSAQLLFGGIGARGKLPVTINEMWPYDFGIITPGNIRMQYGIPESAGMSSVFLEKKIDSIISVGLTLKAFPGCEVMAARKGIVVFQKTYGYQTYDNRISVREDDLFDLASVTKVSSTLPGLMLLDTEGKFSPEETLGGYLPFFRNSNKGDLKMADIMTHQAGLIPWIAFWKETQKKNGELKKRVYDLKYSEKYPLEVANGLYITDKYRKKIFTEIKKSPLKEKKYVYSDLGFIISPDIIERLTGEKWYDFVTENIYHKIGAYDIVFNPWKNYPLSRIIPTEYDSLFRKQLLQGTVHDEGAAMLGGISGHAGLFATANDLMKLLEMYRRMGAYGGEQIIGKEVMERYTRVQFPENDNRRGLGFDKPMLNNRELSQKDANTAKSASPSSFGHSGYTGTFVWVDPEYELTYIFFCNRVYPTRNNSLLSDLNIRSEILQALYDSILK